MDSPRVPEGQDDSDLIAGVGGALTTGAGILNTPDDHGTVARAQDLDLAALMDAVVIMHAARGIPLAWVSAG